MVGRDETVKGYEFAKDQYVVFSAEEIKALEEKATSMIDVDRVRPPRARSQREYLEKVYYLGPDKGGDRAYRLLCEALMQTGRAALGQYAARGKQNLVLLRPRERHPRDGAACTTPTRFARRPKCPFPRAR